MAINNIMNKFLKYFCIIISFTLLCGCEQTDEPEPVVKPVPDGIIKQSALVYAVNANNLSSCLNMNMRQMKEALKALPSGAYELYVFKTTIADGVQSAGLYKAISGEDADFKLIKEYSRDILSTDPQRMREVVNDYLGMETSDDKRTLFLWGHGLAWTPRFTDHTVTRSAINIIENTEIPEMQAFGGDMNNKDWMEIDELKEAIPSAVFNTIWFDCCYMGNIETIYELRDKCSRMVAYPTEIHANGLPYHHVLPYIFSNEYDLTSAAKALYEYYNFSKTCVTVTVMDMSKIKDVAKACADIYSSGSLLPDTGSLQNYSRMSDAFYDLGQYVRKYAELNGASSKIGKFDRAMDNFIIYTVASEKDFNNQPILQENYSGISTHIFKNSSSEKETYYRTLDWFKAVYE